MSRKDIGGRSSAGARASTAGDRYHYTWFARKMLRMLHPRSGPQLLVMEGVPDECYDFGSGDEQYLSVDMSECYGADGYVGADKVIVTQLKYSYAEPNKPWTLGRLCTDKKDSKGKPRPGTSVIGKLARDWETLKNGSPATKLELVVRTNQPLGKRDRATIGVCIQAAEATVASGRASDLFKAKGRRTQDTLSALRKATSLGRAQLARFLCDWSLDGFGAPVSLRLNPSAPIEGREEWRRSVPGTASRRRFRQQQRRARMSSAVASIGESVRRQAATRRYVWWSPPRMGTDTSFVVPSTSGGLSVGIGASPPNP